MDLEELESWVHAFELGGGPDHIGTIERMKVTRLQRYRQMA